MSFGSYNVALHALLARHSLRVRMPPRMGAHVIKNSRHHFLGVSTRVGAFERPAERSELMAVTKAAMCTSGVATSSETGSWSSNLGFCRKRAELATIRT